MKNHTGHIYRFGGDVIEGSGSMRETLGGKGAGLAEMAALGVPVPAGFTIGTEVCRHYLEHGTLPCGLEEELARAISWLEETAGRRFNDPANPLMVSVRSGAPISMPGMMDTILNVGLNRTGVAGLAERSGSQRFALDCLCRLMQMFGTVVLKVPKHDFDKAMKAARAAQGGDEGIDSGADLGTEALASLALEFEKIVEDATQQPFPSEPQLQVNMAVLAVFDSWQSDRARCYRALNDIPDEMGTAVTVQAMVFGNRGENSGTGVGFTRNPSTGEAVLFGEFLTNAQGEDIVAGVRTPRPISELAEATPQLHEELREVVMRLEKHYRDVQDFEFTFEEGRLFLLQTRSAKRSALAAVRNAVEMAEEGLISRREAIERIKPSSLNEILAPQLDLSAAPRELTRGLAASPGAATGQIALSSEMAVKMAQDGGPVMLVTEETSAEDIHGMAVCAGFLTGRGGATSHAAVVARGMGKCCVTGAREIAIDHGSRTAVIGRDTFTEGAWLTVDGGTGRVYAGRLPVKAATGSNAHLNQLLAWAVEASDCLVGANADTPEDARISRSLGAAGIGLCRTEHMFFSPERLVHMRAMILAADTAERTAALDRLLPMQQADFEEIFRQMSPLAVTIRLLDPPLHEFLPSIEEIDAELLHARRDENWDAAIVWATMRERLKELTESNPMMGHRGCRLSLTYPEILQMQVRAVLQAACKVAGEGFEPRPEIMVPLVASEQEMRVLAAMVRKTAAEVLEPYGHTVAYTLGTMIELPRAAVCAASIAKHVDFISFGTNDLTQMTFGFSRDDARSYIDSYLEQRILAADPFVTIDQEGVGQLMQMAIKAVRAVSARIKIGVCGEHAGDPESIGFFTRIGVDYVSCSPSRIPVAQLAVAQSTFANRSAHKCAGSDVKEPFASDRLAPMRAIAMPANYTQMSEDHANAVS